VDEDGCRAGSRRGGRRQSGARPKCDALERSADAHEASARTHERAADTLEQLGLLDAAMRHRQAAADAVAAARRDHAAIGEIQGGVDTTVIGDGPEGVGCEA
jgi:hypothetical protein